MLWASIDGQKELAKPSAKGVCPTCGGEVIAKCGEIVSWHWAHKKCDCDPWYEPESEWHIQWKQQFPAAWQEVTIGKHRADVKTPSGVIELQNSSLSSGAIHKREEFYGRMLWIVNAEKFKDNLIPIIPGEWRHEYMHEKKKPEWQLFPPDPPCRSKFGGLIELLEDTEAASRAYQAAMEKWRNHYQVKKKQDAYEAWIRQRQQYSMHFHWKWPCKTWLSAKKKVYLDLGDSKLFLIANANFRSKQMFIRTKPISKEFFLKQLLQ